MLSRALPLPQNQQNGIQKVLIVLDASLEPSADGIVAAIRSLSLKQGDSVLQLGVMQPFTTDNTSPPCTGCIAVLGRKTKLHSISATISMRKKHIQQEAQKKRKEYLSNPKIADLIKQLQMQQIKFDIEVEADDSLNEITIRVAESLRATCVILDRNMKKDRKYFLDKLSCGILRIKHDSNIETIRGLKIVDAPDKTVRGLKMSEDAEKALKRGQCIHGSHEGEVQEDLFESSTCSLCNNRLLMTRPTVEFTYADLHLATSGFSPRNLLANHGSQIYIGALNDGHTIVVMEHPSGNISENEFKSQAQMLGNVRHQNVATLLGWCSEGQHRLLVYQYVCNGSLNIHLQEKSSSLSWERRMKIALGAAKGLQYLHTKNIYANMKPKNILINHDHHPLLVNYGLARNPYEGLDYSSESRVIKTLEYIAPGYEENSADNISKTDVYSFGVVLLELITGRKTLQETNGQSYLRWARPLLRKKMYPDLVDPALNGSHDLHQLYLMIDLAQECVRLEAERRSSIDKVVKDLECIIHGCSRKYNSPTDSEWMELIKRR
ncbi:PREDICTED: serine/threonine-protein kinase CDG1-like [Ipomoea nil]|uniref:serine/threonine-protein kinase CDG1-like n=1 Tax=Ipomoea nil TaxID=35883 RepID=UPI000901DC64|nr:PREDICTED: serine/threonine-protein kinase CDG1-like [Ipomoea nil]